MNPHLTVYKASAGSGKTFTLTVEYISLVLRQTTADGFRHILAVTFTNKATAEMKERIMQTLYALGNGLPGSELFLQQIKQRTSLDEAVIRQRSLDVLRHILHDYDRFRVETIDSFFQSLLQNLAHELSLTAGFSVDINDSDVTAAAVDGLMSEVDYNPRVLAWILSYIKEKIDENKRWNISKEIKAFARNLFLEKYVVREEEMRKKMEDEAAFNTFRLTLRDKASLAVDVIKSAAENVESIMQNYGLDYDNFSRGSALQTYLKRLATGYFSPPVATVLGYMESSEKWLRKADLKKSAEVLTIVDNELRPALLETEQLRAGQEHVFNSCLLTMQHLGSLRLLDVISRKIKEINDETNHFMLAKTPILLSRMVKGDDTSFVFEKIGIQLRHILIDEFQDTSVLQWLNFKNLVSESIASGHKCLLVGDVKQSIYRWRNGDWGILDNIRKEFPQQPIDIQSLDTNYRSERIVVNFNNDFFTSAAKLLDSLAEDENPKVPSRSISTLYADVAQQLPENKESNKGFVSLQVYDKIENPEWELDMLEEVGNRVFELSDAGLPFSKMVILLRESKHIPPIVDYFSRNHPEVPLVSDEAFKLSSSPTVKTLIHALRYIANPNDNISRAYLSFYYQTEILESPIDWELLTRDKGDICDLLPLELTGNTEALARLPLYELIEKLIRLLSLTKIEGQDAYVMSFLDETQRYIDENTNNIPLFLEYWENTLCARSIPSAKVEGVRIMTIHKSKGLQFHTVLLPYCHWKIEADRLDDLLWCSPDSHPYNTLPLVPISAASKAELSVYASDYAQEHLQRRIENLNLLYVAFTRAERNLMVWCTGKPTLSRSSETVGDLINCVLANKGINESGRYEEGSVCVEIKRKEKQDNKNRLALYHEPHDVAFRSFAGRVEFRQSNSSLDFVNPDSDEETGNNDYIRQGTLLHRVFSHIETPSDLDRVLKQFEQQGLIGGRIKTESLRKLIHRRLQNPLAKRWFDGSGQLFRECNILSHTPNGKIVSRRPDRVIQYDNEVVVVDFKFGKPKLEHHEQVDEYLKLLQAMGHTTVKGYLWYVYSGLVEQVSPTP